MGVVACHASFLEGLASFVEGSFTSFASRCHGHIDDTSVIRLGSTLEGFAAGVDGTTIPEHETTCGTADTLGFTPVFNIPLYHFRTQHIPGLSLRNEGIPESLCSLGLEFVATSEKGECGIAVTDIVGSYPTLNGFETMLGEGLVTVVGTSASPSSSGLFRGEMYGDPIHTSE